MFNTARRPPREGPRLSTRIKRWSARRRRSTRKNHTSDSEEESPMLQNEGEDCLAALKPWNFSKRGTEHRAGEYSGAKSTNHNLGKIHGTHGRPERSAEPKQRTRRSSEKTEKLGQPSGESSNASGRTLLKRRRRSESSSHAHPSTTGTTSTPHSAAIHKNHTGENTRYETPSPTIPVQVLRLLLGPGISPPSKATTQLDLRRHEPDMLASTPHLARRSRDSRPSSRPSIDYKNRSWIPFWGTPKPQAEQNKVDEASTQDNDLEPAQGEHGRSRWTGQKKGSDMRSRRRWRSG
ncbi:hypothetical protein GGS26DRAFT_576905 [Hypomontagnella submonticulosa]|nr:hypothetical protein GGS26DRAFT_576905 [Hypomontagnella submonticulosa]